MWFHKLWLTTKKCSWTFMCECLWMWTTLLCWGSLGCINVQYWGFVWHGCWGTRWNAPPYLLRDRGYPLLSWLLTPHKEKGEDHFFWNYCITTNTRGFVNGWKCIWHIEVDFQKNSIKNLTTYNYCVWCVLCMLFIP
jgi:hypothetical protein